MDADNKRAQEIARCVFGDTEPTRADWLAQMISEALTDAESETIRRVRMETIEECARVCVDRAMTWDRASAQESEAENYEASDFAYDKASEAGRCAEEIRALLSLETEQSK